MSTKTYKQIEAEMSEELKPEEQELVDGLLLLDNFCRTNDIDIEAVAEYLLNKKSPWIKIKPEAMPEIPIRTRLLTARMDKEPLELEDGFNCPCAVAIMCEDEKWYTYSNKTGEYKPTHYQKIELPKE